MLKWMRFKCKNDRREKLNVYLIISLEARLKSVSMSVIESENVPEKRLNLNRHTVSGYKNRHSNEVNAIEMMRLSLCRENL